MISLQVEMDQSDDWKVRQGGVKFQKHHYFPKRILQFVFSVSTFSFLLWYSFGCSILPHDESLNAFFSTFLFSIFSHTLQRKYMFLLCNAILAFLAKTSLSSSSDKDESLQAATLQDTTNAIPVSVEAPSLMAEEQGKKQEHCEEEEEVPEADEENIEEASIAKEDEQVRTTEESSCTDDQVTVGTRDDEADNTTVVEDNEELSNADELNRKFEEFIRKMKEEMRVEAQRQLIAV
ncbi:uncharacterized protein LOC129286127 [Prosopis cineraria]|uniref:uncharacterized protein LOC129286127 n=1 Tax=Prosopis cineraria TaxID=364024 RepID=UPI0024107908|nr:uncharacterized protein LOC129286127 [Prosopis cineraria]